MAAGQAARWIKVHSLLAPSACTVLTCCERKLNAGTLPEMRTARLAELLATRCLQTRFKKLWSAAQGESGLAARGGPSGDTFGIDFMPQHTFRGALA